MILKTPRHKHYLDTFGVISDSLIYNEYTRKLEWEILHCAIPDLHPITATKELFIEYWKKHLPDSQTVLEQLEDYDMVEVEVLVK